MTGKHDLITLKDDTQVGQQVIDDVLPILRDLRANHRNTALHTFLGIAKGNVSLEGRVAEISDASQYTPEIAALRELIDVGLIYVNPLNEQDLHCPEAVQRVARNAIKHGTHRHDIEVESPEKTPERKSHVDRYVSPEGGLGSVDPWPVAKRGR